MAFADVRVCWSCTGLWIEDDRMYADVDRCPNCGASASERPESCRARAAGRAEDAVEGGIVWDDSGAGILWDEGGEGVKW